MRRSSNSWRPAKEFHPVSFERIRNTKDWTDYFLIGPFNVKVLPEEGEFITHNSLKKLGKTATGHSGRAEAKLKHPLAISRAGTCGNFLSILEELRAAGMSVACGMTLCADRPSIATYDFAR